MSTSLKLFDWLEVIVLTFLFLLQFFYAGDTYFICGLVMAIILSLKLKKEYITLTPIDYCILLIGLYDLYSIFTSVNPLKSFSYLKTSLYCICYYWILRFSLTDDSKTKVLLSSYCWMFGLLSILAVTYFRLFTQSIHSIGFSDLYPFRHFYQPLGISSNEWANLQILAGGIVILCIHYYRKSHKKLFIISAISLLILFQMVISFSRGIYLALLPYLFCLIFVAWKSMGKRYFFFLLSGIFVILLSLFITYHQEIITTLRMNHTVSQQRSLYSRVNELDATKQFVKDHPWGSGNGNYTLSMDSYLYENDEAGITSYASNLIIQILVEKGWTGFLLYSLLFIVILITICRRKDITTWGIGLILLTYLFKEQTFSVFFMSVPACLFVYTLLAILLSPKIIKEKHASPRNRYTYWLPVGIWLLLFIGIQWDVRNKRHNSSFLTAVENGNTQQAIQEIEQTERIPAYLLNRSLFYLNSFEKTKDSILLVRAENAIRSSISQNPSDIHLTYFLSIILEKRQNEKESIAIKKDLAKRYPENTLFQWGMFKQTYRTGNKTTACNHLVKAIILSPAILDSEFWIKFKENDSLFCKEIATHLYNHIASYQEENPIRLAKSGKIALSLNNIPLAKKKLEKALAQLPNLSMAWYNLSKAELSLGNKGKACIYEKRACVLSMGVLSTESMHKKFTDIQSKPRLINKILLGNYNIKFTQWYSDKLYPFQIE
ncbi:O-antigen ligase family protein [Bacteroides sp. AN502(2024)]|uniref:O-antigen ligase family protein n=1 Tax=Bacteroides sp. AN502(2024) TaxID=3160599 RepID=UPI0035183CBB